MRCVTCWPSDGSRTNARADVAVSAPGTRRGDPRITDDEQPQLLSGSRCCGFLRRHACWAAVRGERWSPSACQARQHGGVRSEQNAAGRRGSRGYGRSLSSHIALSGMRSGGTDAEIVPRTASHASKVLCIGCGRFEAVFEAKGGCGTCSTRSDRRRGRDPVFTSPLLHRKAPHVFDASRCRSMPVQRREDRSKLDHSARIATRALSPVIRSHFPPLAPGTPGEKCWMDNRTKIRYTFYTDHLHTWRPYL